MMSHGVFLTHGLLLAAAALVASACKAPEPLGDPNSIIVWADSSVWLQVDSAVMGKLEEPVFTTRPERLFTLKFIAPDDPAWSNFRLFRQILVLGTREDPLVAELVKKSNHPDAAPPAVVQTKDRWAREQTVTILLLPPGSEASAVNALLAGLYDLLLQQYDDRVIERMYVSGVNDSLANALAAYGFSLQLPRVYTHSQENSFFRFRNYYQHGDTDLMRSLLVTWTNGATEVGEDSLLAWRKRIAETQYDPAQDVDPEHIRFAAITVNDLPGLEMRGVWHDRTEFLAAGPFIARAITCPSEDRTYYMDAWLYYPTGDKFPYVRQLEVILGTFRCPGDGARAAE